MCIRGSRVRNVNEMEKKKNTLMIQTISNMFMASASTKNESSIVRQDFNFIEPFWYHN